MRKTTIITVHETQSMKETDIEAEQYCLFVDDVAGADIKNKADCSNIFMAGVLAAMLKTVAEAFGTKETLQMAVSVLMSEEEIVTREGSMCNKSN